MRGIIIAVPQKYQKITFQNLYMLRNLHGCMLPVELWEIGKEMDDDYRSACEGLGNVRYMNVADYTSEPDHWRGFQVKAFILKHTAFTEPILCDADIVFHQNPEKMYDNEGYKQTGAYFFRDLTSWRFYNLCKCEDKFRSIDFFNKRKDWIRSLLPTKSPLFPSEWSYIYDNEPPTHPVQEALMESGCVYMDKDKQQDSIDKIYELNYNHKETYEYVWGDKETFWLGCVLANKPYAFNTIPGISEEGRLLHIYENNVFFTQKF